MPQPANPSLALTPDGPPGAQSELAHDPTSAAPIHVPEPFTDLVRDALLHLYDPAQLQAHPLVAVTAGSQPITDVGASVGGSSMGGRVLRQALLDAIDALQ